MEKEGNLKNDNSMEGRLRRNKPAGRSQETARGADADPAKSGREYGGTFFPAGCVGPVHFSCPRVRMAEQSGEVILLRGRKPEFGVHSKELRGSGHSGRIFWKVTTGIS